MNWLHISDFHFKDSGDYASDTVTNALLNSLPDLISRIGTLDLIIASGDIAHSGLLSEYREATKFFDRLLAITNIKKSNLVVIPGNHDVDRKRSIGLVRSLSSIEEAIQYFANGSSLKHVESKLSGFKSWYDEYFDGQKTFITTSTFMPEERFVAGNLTLRVLPINTASFCVDDNDHGKLFVGRPCLDAAVTNSHKNGDNSELSIAVLHHPFDWLHSSEITQVKAKIREACDCILTGHLHTTDVEQIYGLSGDALQLAAGAVFQSLDKNPNKAMFCNASRHEVKVTPISYYDAPTPRWAIDPSIFPNEPNYTRTFLFPKSMGKQMPQASSTATREASANYKKIFEENLLTAPSGEVLYVDHRLMDRPQAFSLDENETEPRRVTIREIVESDKSIFIMSKAEFGGTTLCNRIMLEFGETDSASAMLQDARKLPAYRKRLEPLVSAPRPAQVLVLDNFDLEQDERLLKELSGLGFVKRVIAIVSDRTMEVTVPSDTISYMKDRLVLHVWGLAREDVRSLTRTICASNDEAFISEIVDKVYKDLLALCIPLTANNVIMYLRILNREGNYVPINRVDIIDKFLHTILQDSGDLGGRRITAQNKIDVMSAFCYKLYLHQKDVFDDRFWYDFVSDYQRETLFEFDAERLFRDAFSARIFLRFGNLIFIRYSFYFEFFLGRHLTSKQPLLAKFVEAEEYLRIKGTIEVITGLSGDNNFILERLVSRAEDLQAEFASKYVESTFDILQIAKWAGNDKEEEEQVWQPVAKQIEAGPKNTKEIDRLKTSLIAEARTNDQSISFSKFIDLEVALFTVGHLLRDALRNCDDASGPLKIRAYNAIARHSLIAFQVGVLLTPQIATRRYASWGRVAFFDFNRVNEQKGEMSRDEQMFRIAQALADSIACQDAERIATAKLSPVFKSQISEMNGNSFLGLFSFACVLNAKGNNWHVALGEIIDKTHKSSLYLLFMLRYLVKDLSEEILSGRDRSLVQHLIAHVHAKRSLGKQSPGARAIKKTMERLKASKYPPFQGTNENADIEEESTS